jgi:hypothetical protein
LEEDARLCDGDELLSAVIAEIKDIDIAPLVNRDVGGSAELSWFRPKASGHRKGLAVGRELLDSVVIRVCDIDIAGVIEAKSRRVARLSGNRLLCLPT